MSDTLSAFIKAAVKTLKSQRTTALPAPSQLFTLRVTKKVDLIFTPRDYPYNEKELEYIHSLAPFEHLPLSLVPTDLGPYPPLMQYGWMLSDSLKEQLYRCADTEGHNYVERSSYTFNNETLTFQIALHRLLEGLELSWSRNRYIHLVVTKSDRQPARLFTLYSNQELHDIPNGNLPSKEDIEKICIFFQLTGSPSWYPTALDFEWSDSPLY